MAYYNAGMRVVRYSRADGIEEMGKFIDDEGSNFWGVEQFTDAAGNRLIAGSDRDFGLQIFKYTGPGAVLAPPPPPPPPPHHRRRHRHRPPTVTVPGPPHRRPPPVVVPPPPPPPAPARPSSIFKFGQLTNLTFSNRPGEPHDRVPWRGQGRGTGQGGHRARDGSRSRARAGR